MPSIPLLWSSGTLCTVMHGPPDEDVLFLQLKAVQSDIWLHFCLHLSKLILSEPRLGQSASRKYCFDSRKPKLWLEAQPRKFSHHILLRSTEGRRLFPKSREVEKEESATWLLFSGQKFPRVGCYCSCCPQALFRQAAPENQHNGETLAAKSRTIEEITRPNSLYRSASWYLILIQRS